MTFVRTIISKIGVHLRSFAHALGLALFTSLCFASTSSAQAQPDKSIPDLTGTPWVGLNVPPGTQLLVTKSSKGEPIKTLKFPGHVILSQMPNGTIRDTDNSGKGAVLCLQWIYLEAKKAIEECPQPAAVEQNLQEAYFWLRLVPDSAPSYTEASRILKRIRPQLSPDQIDALDKRLATWTPTPSRIGDHPRLGSGPIKEIKKRAEQGDPNSQYELSIMYKEGVPEDYDLSGPFTPEEPNWPETEKWLHKAAEQGHVTAQSDLGVLYEAGVLGRPDFAAAEKWFREAAEQGHQEAQLSLGNLYAQGAVQMSDADLADLLDEALDKIADFVLANSLQPTTKGQIIERYRTYKLPHGCLGDVGARSIIKDLKAKSPEQFKRSVDDLLSIPRPPVMNPCL